MREIAFLREPDHMAVQYTFKGSTGYIRETYNTNNILPVPTSECLERMKTYATNIRFAQDKLPAPVEGE
jgi:hypothetical protein